MKMMGFGADLHPNTALNNPICQENTMTMRCNIGIPKATLEALQAEAKAIRERETIPVRGYEDDDVTQAKVLQAQVIEDPTGNGDHIIAIEFEGVVIDIPKTPPMSMGCQIKDLHCSICARELQIAAECVCEAKKLGLIP